MPATTQFLCEYILPLCVVNDGKEEKQMTQTVPWEAAPVTKSSSHICSWTPNHKNPVPANLRIKLEANKLSCLKGLQRYEFGFVCMAQCARQQKFGLLPLCINLLDIYHSI